MVKMIGCGFIFFAAFMRIYTFRVQEKRTIQDLREIIKLIEHVHLQIEYFSSPFVKILEKFQSPLGVSVEEINRKLAENLYLRADERQLVIDWLSSIGNGYKSEQLNLCAYTKEKLACFLNDRVKEFPSKIKANFSLTLLVSVSLIVLFM